MSAKHPNISHIQKYLNGELDAKAMHQLERQAHNDPFLMEALEGHHTTGANHQAHMDDLQDRLANRIATNKPKRIVILWWVLPVAASILIIMVVGLLWLSPKRDQKQNAANQPVKHSKPIALKADTATHPAQQMAAVEVAETPKQQPVTHTQQRVAVNAHRVRHHHVIAVADVATKSISHKPVAKTALPDSVATVKQTEQQALAKPPKTTGYVTDTMGHPLAGVKVSIKGTNMATVTDANGVFTINTPSPQQMLNIDYAGYDSKQIALGTNHIVLNESAVALPEISIPSHSDVKYTGQAKAQPIDGWKNYRAYIRKNAVMPDGETGKVKLSFTVLANGSISNIKVIKGRTDAMNLKAIDLVKNGPEWRGDMEAREVKLKIKFHKSRKA